MKNLTEKDYEVISNEIVEQILMVHEESGISLHFKDQILRELNDLAESCIDRVLSLCEVSREIV